jgi:hypothetical protein
VAQIYEHFLVGERREQGWQGKHKREGKAYQLMVILGRFKPEPNFLGECCFFLHFEKQNATTPVAIPYLNLNLNRLTNFFFSFFSHLKKLAQVFTLG